MFRCVPPKDTWILALLAASLLARSAMAQTPMTGVTTHRREMDGVLQPYHDVDVATAETGILRRMLVKPGMQVVQGEPLAELDTDAIRGQLEVKRAEAEAVGKVDQARAELKLQQAKLEKLRALKADGKSSAAEVERAETDVIIAQGRLRQEEENIQILVRDLERYERLLQERTLRAPIDGIVTDIHKQVGEFVAPNSPVILRLVDPRKLRATFSIQESELPQFEVGSIIRVQISNGQIAEGKVEFVPPMADPETGWFMISVILENEDGKIIGSRCQRLD